MTEKTYGRREIPTYWVKGSQKSKDNQAKLLFNETSVTSRMVENDNSWLVFHQLLHLRLCAHNS